MPEAARLGDPTQHGTPLGPGTGSPTVKIGGQPAWRAIPSSMAAGVEGASNAMKQVMDKPDAAMTPADTTPILVEAQAQSTAAASAAAAEGNAGASAGVSGGYSAAQTTNATLTTAWGTASAAPGGQPAANIAYAQGIKAAAGAAAAAAMSAIAAGICDVHICPTPTPPIPHGPGLVTKGSGTVMINGLPAARKGDKVFEACGGPDEIAMGCPTVKIGG